MKRKVFIIKGLSKTDEERKTDRYYVEKYKTFFSKNAGGAYEDDEIITFEEPTSKDLIASLENEVLDYGILVYIGHGATQHDNQLFQLNDSEIIKAGQFVIKSPKQIVIVESCRVDIDGVYTVDLEDHIPKFKYGGTVRRPLSKEIARHVYDCHIQRCKDGIMICFACSKGQSAYNYYFSMLVLQNAIDWYLETHRHCSILPIDDLMGLTLFNTLQLVKSKLGEEQQPSRIGILNYPFAVSRY